MSMGEAVDRAERTLRARERAEQLLEELRRYIEEAYRTRTRLSRAEIAELGRIVHAIVSLGYSYQYISQRLGIPDSTLKYWARVYRREARGVSQPRGTLKIVLELLETYASAVVSYATGVGIRVVDRLRSIARIDIPDDPELAYEAGAEFGEKLAEDVVRAIEASQRLREVEERVARLEEALRAIARAVAEVEALVRRAMSEYYEAGVVDPKVMIGLAEKAREVRELSVSVLRSSRR